MTRPTRCVLLFVICVIASVSSAPAANFPDRPIRVMVGFSAGGGTDVVARILAPKLSETLGQSVLVENRPGASGLIAAEAAARSAPDGYTLMMGSQTTFAVAPALHPKSTLDPAKGFAGVALAGISPLVLVGHPSWPARSVSEVIAMAKAAPGAINFGSGGIGTTPHMAAELFSYFAGIKMAHVAYRGEAPAINDLLGGQIPLMFANLSAVIGNIKAGRLRALAVTGARRSAALPDIPTVAESLPGFEAATWFALVAPAATARDLIAQLNVEVQRALAQMDVQQRFAELGMSGEASTPDQLDAYIRAEIAKWTKLIKDAGIQAAE